MVNNLTVIGNKEFLLVAENIAHEKGIMLHEILDAVEQGMTIVAKGKYGSDLNIQCSINEKTGEISLHNKILVVEDQITNEKQEILIKNAKLNNPDIKIGDFVMQELPPIGLSRANAKLAIKEIVKNIKIAEKEKEYEACKEKVGTIVYANVKKIGIKNIVMEVEGFEAVIHRSNLLPREYFNVDDKVRVYIEDVRRENFGAQIFLSRSHPEFLVKLFAQEVPELYDNKIEVKAVARDPGSRSKIAIYSDREDLDIIGSFIGIRGSRVQAVTSELKGEKIDIIKWSPNLGELIVDALSPAKISKVIIDEDVKSIEVVTSEENLSLAIGRNGQNVRLASKLVGYSIDIITEEEDSAKRVAELNTHSKMLMEILDVEDMIATLLVTEGFSSVKEIVNASEGEIGNIEGFDSEIENEIRSRALEYLEKKDEDAN